MPTSTNTNLYTHPTEGWTLRGDAAASYLRMRAAGMPAGGVQVFHRTYAQQAELRRRYELGIGPIAARPTPNAPHIKGVAVDLRTSTSSGAYSPSTAFLWMVAGAAGTPSKAPRYTSDSGMRAHAYGWSRTVPSERWHFGYNPSADRKAAADLKARLKLAGYGSVKAFQKSVGLTVDGKAGPLTWTALLKAKAAPPAKTPPAGSTAPAAQPFRFGQINLQAERWGGVDDASDTRGDWLAGEMRCSVYCLAEVTETARNHIRAAIPGGADRWRVYPQGMSAVLFDASKWAATGRDSVFFGEKDNGIHGAVRAQLINKGNGQALDVIAVHIRPGAAIPGTDARKLAAKMEDIAKALTLVRPGMRTIVAGDWNTKYSATAAWPGGFVRATPALDSSDDAGDQPIDATYAYGLTVRGASQINPGKVSDHLGWIVNLTLPTGSTL